MKLDAASNFVQLRAITIATAIQAALHRCKEYNSEETDLNENKEIYHEVFQADPTLKSWIKNHFFKVITPIVLAGLVARKSRFKRLILSTSIIAGGCLGIDCLLSRRRPLRMKKEDFERKIVTNNFPNRPIFLDQKVCIQNSTDNIFLPKNLYVDKGGLDLEGCTNIRSLPRSLCVRGDINFKNCTSITHLPRVLELTTSPTAREYWNRDNILVSKKSDLNLEGCTSLTSLIPGLHIEGDLILEDCTSLTELPAGIRVGGDLNLKGCTSLRSLPLDLHVAGNLILEDCPSLTAFPGEIRVGENLNLRGCKNLNSLPVELQIGGVGRGGYYILGGDYRKGGLDLEGCTSLTSLPRGLHIEGNLSLIGCTGLTSIPEDLQVSHDLLLEGCSNLEEIPAAIEVHGEISLKDCVKITSIPIRPYIGGLDLRGCSGITELPEGLQVGGRLVLSNSNIHVLPKGLQAAGNLSLKNQNITEFPEDLRRLGGLIIRDCPLLTALPEGLVLGKEGMDIGKNTGIQTLPNGLRIEGKLELDCELTELPDNLHVGGNLKDFGKSLTKLGNGSYVGGDVCLSSSKIERLPEDFKFEGDLLMGGSSLRYLPSWITHLGAKPARLQHMNYTRRIISLCGTRISQDDVERLRAAYEGNPDINLSVEDQFDPSVFFTPFFADESPFASAESQENLEILGFAPTDQPTEHDIEQAFRGLSLQHHPDKGGDPQIFIKIKAAKEKLLETLSEWSRYR